MMKENKKSITKIVQDQVSKLKTGKIITYDDFNIPAEKTMALAKALSRLVNKKELIRISKGKFYKPIESIFRNLRPAEKELVKDLIEENGKIIGYISGIALYNRLGLTTQVPNEYMIATNKEKKSIERKGIKISFLRQENKINRKNIRFLQILDAIRDIKKIPDSNSNDVSKLLISIIKKLSVEERKQLAKLALKYNPATRALTGAFLELISKSEITHKLKSTLNPLTTYELGIDEKTLPTKSNWFIK